MNMAFVGIKRRLSRQDTLGKHPHRIENRDKNHGHDQNRRIRSIEQTATVQIAEFQSKKRNNESQHQRSAISHKHFQPRAGNVIHEKYDQRTQHAHTQRGIDRNTVVPEPSAKRRNSNGTETGAKSVHPVDQIKGIDNQHHQTDRYRNSYRRRNIPNSEQTVETFHIDPAGNQH